MDDPVPPSFADVFAAADRIPGWLTQAQARVLWDASQGLPATGRIVEIGSHQGRSTIVLAAAGPATVTAVDPFEPDWRYGTADTRARFESHVAEAGVADRVDLRVARSTDLRRDWIGPIDLLYIDGKHDFWTVRDDLRWDRHVVASGTVLVHDAFSSIGVTLALVPTLLTSNNLRYLGRTGSLARLEVGSPTLADRFRPMRELPWWARNVLVKVLLRLRLRPLARILGHGDVHDPY